MKQLKATSDSPEISNEKTEEIVKEMLLNLEKGRENIAKSYSLELDSYEGEVVLTREQIEEAIRRVPKEVKDDIQFAMHILP